MDVLRTAQVQEVAPEEAEQQVEDVDTQGVSHNVKPERQTRK
jgi:hypothetical protein